MTDTEINEAVAKKLGKPYKDIPWHQNTHGHRTGMDGFCIDGCEKKFPDGYQVPDYCNSIEAAWDVVEKVFSARLSKNPAGHKWLFEFIEDGIIHTAQADTAPMAICLAFLKLP